MESKKFFGFFKEAARDMHKTPKVIVPALLLWLFISILSRVSVNANYGLSNTISITAWLILISLISLGSMAFVFSGIIGMTKKSFKGEVCFGDFIFNAKKFWLRNFAILIIITIISVVLGRIAHYGGLFIGSAFNLSLIGAQAIFILIYFLGLIGILIFLTFSSFYLVLGNLKIKESIKSSINLVRKEYFATLGLSLILFVLLFLVGLIPGKIGEVLDFGLVIPYSSFVLTRFVLKNKPA